MVQEYVTTYETDPGARLNYGFDWSDWLPVGDTIAASTWVASAGITVDTSTFNSTTTTIFLSGGTLGDEYKITNHITTVNNLQDERTFLITCVER
jgi:hypothetical protein